MNIDEQWKLKKTTGAWVLMYKYNTYWYMYKYLHIYTYIKGYHTYSCTVFVFM